MALLLNLYDALRETIGEEKARKAIEDLESHIQEIKAEQATKSDIAMVLEQMDKRFEQMDKRFEQMEKRFEQMEKRFELLKEEMEKRFEQVDKRFEYMDKRFEQMDKRFEHIEKRFAFMQWLIVAVGGFISGLITLVQFLGR